MKALKLGFFSLVLGMAVSGAACDGADVEAPASITAALGSADDVVVDGKVITGENPRSAARSPSKRGADSAPADSYITSKGDGPTVVFNDFATEGDGPGVVRDCTATASECNASCSVVGEGTCDAGATSVTCSITYPCGDNICETSHTQHCN